MSEVMMTALETVRAALAYTTSGAEIYDADAALDRIERVVGAAEAVETAWTTGHIRRARHGGDASTIRGRDAMKRLREALGALDG